MVNIEMVTQRLHRSIVAQNLAGKISIIVHTDDLRFEEELAKDLLVEGLLSESPNHPVDVDQLNLKALPQDAPTATRVAAGAARHNHAYAMELQARLTTTEAALRDARELNEGLTSALRRLTAGLPSKGYLPVGYIRTNLTRLLKQSQIHDQT